MAGYIISYTVVELWVILQACAAFNSKRNDDDDDEDDDEDDDALLLFRVILQTFAACKRSHIAFARSVTWQ